MNYDGGISGTDEQKEEVESIRDTRQPVGADITARGAGGLRRSRTVDIENEDERLGGVRVVATKTPELTFEARSDEQGSSESDGWDEDEKD